MIVPDAKLQEMLALASAATPGPWLADPDDRPGMAWNIHIVQRKNPDMRVCFMTSDGLPQTATHIANCDPQTISAIVSELIERRNKDAEHAE